ncbi:unnamed protein product [Sphagnum troendelagicum]|uniref:PsbP C-terminal domain-containing protein n=1 Tax=Sphagnum troendelagicum TaxID=128251 RepID=A0ABP0THA3_9BRYO
MAMAMAVSWSAGTTPLLVACLPSARNNYKLVECRGNLWSSRRVRPGAGTLTASCCCWWWCSSCSSSLHGRLSDEEAQDRSLVIGRQDGAYFERKEEWKNSGIWRRSMGGRREALLFLVSSFSAVSAGGVREANAAEETQQQDGAAVPLNLEPYNDEKEGFKLLRPVQWNKVEKAGATLLFEDPATRGNTIGVVVNPVRIASLKDFGSLDEVADKLIAAERRKPSTNDAQLVRVQERQAHGDTPLYELEYTLDSSRGKKRILSAVTVASRKLYILNIAYVDSPATPAPTALAAAFQQILTSFDLLN